MNFIYEYTTYVLYNQLFLFQLRFPIILHEYNTSIKGKRVNQCNILTKTRGDYRKTWEGG